MSDLLSRIDGSHQSSEKLRLLVEAAHMLNSSIEYEELMKNVLLLLTRAVDAEAAMVYRYDHEHKDLRGRFYSGDQDPQHMTFKMGQGFVGWVAQNKQPVLSDNPTEDDRYCPNVTDLENFELKSILCYPLLLRGKFFGVIEAINKKDGGFNQSDMDTFDILSDQIAVAIYNAQLYRIARLQGLQRETLFEVSQQLMSSLTLDEVLHNILLALQKVVDFDAGGIYLIDEKSDDVESITSVGYDKVLEPDLHLKIGEGVVGWVARSGKAEVVVDVSQDDRYINARPQTKSEIVVPVTSDGKMVGILNLENDDLDAFSAEDQHILSTFATQAAISIERARMHKYVLEQKKLEQQLSIARTIQKTFLPDSVPETTGYDIWGTNIPSGEVGGDYYDFIDIVDNQLGIAIADVSGKGIPAALIMASFRASLIAEIRNNYAIRIICSKVNNLLCESVEPGNFVTAIYGVLDSKNSVFTFSGCGHNPALLLRTDGSVEELIEGGMLMGVQKNTTYEERPIYIQSGDILCLYTDGIIEAEDNTDQQFGLERLVEMIKTNRDRPSADTGKQIIETVKAFADPKHTLDDLTLILIKRRQ